VLCLLAVLVKLSLLAKWLARNSPLGTPNHGKEIISTKPRPKRAYDFFHFYVLFHCFIVCLSCPPALYDISQKFRRDSNSSCAFWSIAVSITRRRLTSPSHFTWPLSWCSSPSSIGQHVDTYCAVNPPVQDRRPSLSSGSSVCLELSAIEHQDCLVFERVSGRPQNSSVQSIVWWPDKTAPIFPNNWHLQPVTFVHCPCNSFNCDSVTLNTFTHSFILLCRALIELLALIQKCSYCILISHKTQHS